MSYENYDPAISDMKYIVNSEPFDGTIILTEEPVNIEIKATFAGIKFLKNLKQEYFNSLDGTDYNVFPDLNIYCVHFTQRGARDIVVHGFNEIPIKDFSSDLFFLEYNLGTFYKGFKFDDSPNEFIYDMTGNILYFNISVVSDLDAAGFKTLDKRISHAIQYPLHSFKVPMVTDNGF